MKKYVKLFYYQNVKPNIDKVMSNPANFILTGNIPGAIASYFYRPDFDARKAKTKDEAYEMARSTGAKTFIWNGDRYNTDYKGNPKKTLVQQKQEELDTYGITNEQTQNKNLIAKRLYNNLIPYGYNNAISRVFKTVLLDKKEENNLIDKNSSDFKKKSDSFGLLVGYPQKNNTFEISDYRPKNAEENYYFKYKDSNYMISDYPSKELNKIYKKLDNNDDLFINYKIDWKSHQKNDSIYKREMDEILKKHDSIETNSEMDSEDKSIKGTSYIDRENQFMTTGKQDIPIGSNKVFEGSNVGDFTIGRGKDYFSYYDKWDINPFGQGNDKPIYELGKPLHIYDRKYFKKQGGSINYISLFKNGGYVKILNLGQKNNNK